MAIQDFTAGQVLTAVQMDNLQANDYNQTVSTKTASYTLVAADKGTRVVMNSASATTITVNTSLFNAGDTLILQNISTGVCTVTAGTATVSTAGSLAIPQNGSGLLYFTSAGVSIFYPSDIKSGVVQVQSTTKTDTFTVSGSTFVDVTGLTVTITPTSASNKIFIVASVVASQDVAVNNGFLRLARGATGIDLGDAAGLRRQATVAVDASSTNYPESFSMSFLDSPATTSATTYAVQISAHAGGGAMYVNRSDTDTNDAFNGRYASTITVFEVTP